MRRQFHFQPAAEQGLNDAATYYVADSRGLGRAFLREVQHAVKPVLEYPQSTPLDQLRNAFGRLVVELGIIGR